MENKKRILLIIVLLITLFFGFMVRGSSQGILFDEFLMESIHNKTTDLGIFIMKKVTFLGSAYFFVFLGLLISIKMIRSKNIEGIKLLLFSTLGSFLLNYLLKLIFMRIRPLNYFLIEQGGYSFPSGHAMVSMSFYTTMTYMLIKNIENKRIEKLLWFLNFGLVAFIGFSRIYLGVHWPTDVLVAYLLGYGLYFFIR